MDLFLRQERFVDRQVGTLTGQSCISDTELTNFFIGEQRYEAFTAYCASPEIARVTGGSIIGKRGNCKTIKCDEK